MRILAVSHSCVVDVNQRLFVALSRQPDTELLLVVPERWKSDYTGAMFAPSLLPDVDFPVLRAPVIRPGDVVFHAYTRLPIEKIRAFQPDLIYSTQEPYSLSHAQFDGLARRLKIPIVFHTNQNLKKRYPPPFGWLEKRAYAHAALALAYSEEARGVLLEKGRRGPAAVIPYGTDTAQFTPGREPDQRAAWGVDGRFVAGYLGRLVADKGLDLLIDAVAALPELPLTILLVGSGTEEDALRRRAAERGITERVVFAGPVAHGDAGKALRCMDTLVLPSRTTPRWKEQFGRVLIEAMATGIPVIGSDSGEIPNLIGATGGGLIFREGDSAELADKLRTLATDGDLRSRLAAAGSAAVTAGYTFEAVARRLRAALDTVFSGPK
jgi:glycosyltransferase involved in cell wall biosynthesis